jgi:hypothetical protein
MRRAFWLAACFLLAFVCARAQDNDWLIVPGKRVGPITASSTRADLVRVFGAKNVADGDFLTSDMGSENATRVYRDQPEMSLAIFWISDAADSHIRSVRVCPNLILPGKCRWRTAESVTLGVTLKDLERLNGRAFQLNGFDWGFGGLITSWNGGHLDKLATSCGGLNLRLDPPAGPASDDRARLMDQVEGNDEFPSADTAMQALNPVVDFLSVSFQNCR